MCVTKETPLPILMAPLRHSKPIFSLIVPTCNAMGHWAALRSGIEMQSVVPNQVIIIDSCSTDRTVECARSAGFDVMEIQREEFNHGGTRQRAAEAASGASILLYMTQDAILNDPDAFKKMLGAFDDPTIGAAFGRQLPIQTANPMEAHARNFNYPATSRVRTFECRYELGFKSIFFSNSFGAYRRAALMSVGGFPDDVIFGEDTVVTARLHRAGWKTAYVAEACVQHSHRYSIAEEFQRYFDIGVLHGRERWLIEQFGAANGEGKRFVSSELRYLLRNNAFLIPVAVFRSATKYLAYQLGLREKQLGLWLKCQLGKNKSYWLQSPKESQRH
jgi:rhamnosyltransferase